LNRWLLSPAATADLEGIAAFLDEHAPHATTRVLVALRDSMRGIAENPGRGRRRTDLSNEPVRFVVVWSYLVVYRTTDPVEVVRVLHGARDVIRELRRPRRR
jgi:toxin ParE1/3/4